MIAIARSAQAAGSRSRANRSCRSVWAFRRWQFAGRQAASLEDGDSAAITVSAETGTENMGKS